MIGDNAISTSWMGDTRFGSTASAGITLFLSFLRLPGHVPSSYNPRCCRQLEGPVDMGNDHT